MRIRRQRERERIWDSLPMGEYVTAKEITRKVNAESSMSVGVFLRMLSRFGLVDVVSRRVRVYSPRYGKLNLYRKVEDIEFDKVVKMLIENTRGVRRK